MATGRRAYQEELAAAIGRQSINVNAATIVWDVDLSSVDDRRIELAEYELDTLLLRIPEDFQRSVFRQVGLGRRQAVGR